MTIFRYIVILSFTISLVLSNTECEINVDTPNKDIFTQKEFNYIDEKHTLLSRKVMEWSKSLDKMLCNVFDDNETNTPTIKFNSLENNISVNDTKSIDSFFQNQKYLDETDNTFVRVRIDTSFESRESNDIALKVSAQLPLIESRKRFKIFIEDITLDNAKDILNDNSDNNIAPDIGIHYFAAKTYGIDSKYSVGFSGLDPFVSARYNYNIFTNETDWKIDPVQLFKYSTGDKFEEETNIYFDKSFEDLSLFRLQLHRKTQTEIDGMDYAAIFQYYWNPKKETGFRISQAFLGNTKYQYIEDKNSVSPHIKDYSGINNYISSFSWRENVWRKWFYFEVRPSVNFHKQYNYQPNYAMRFFLDFYFGQHN